jgi:hypothetical protein
VERFPRYLADLIESRTPELGELDALPFGWRTRQHERGQSATSRGYMLDELR